MGKNPPIARVRAFTLLAALAATTCNRLILGAFTLDQLCNALFVTALKGKAKLVVHSIKSRSLGTRVVQQCDNRYSSPYDDQSKAF